MLDEPAVAHPHEIHHPELDVEPGRRRAQPLPTWRPR
jgi:hypothetical protein